MDAIINLENTAVSLSETLAARVFARLEPMTPQKAIEAFGGLEGVSDAVRNEDKLREAGLLPAFDDRVLEALRAQVIERFDLSLEEIDRMREAAGRPALTTIVEQEFAERIYELASQSAAEAEGAITASEIDQAASERAPEEVRAALFESNSTALAALERTLDSGRLSPTDGEQVELSKAAVIEAFQAIQAARKLNEVAAARYNDIGFSPEQAKAAAELYAAHENIAAFARDERGAGLDLQRYVHKPEHSFAPVVADECAPLLHEARDAAADCDPAALEEETLGRGAQEGAAEKVSLVAPKLVALDLAALDIPDLSNGPIVPSAVQTQAPATAEIEDIEYVTAPVAAFEAAERAGVVAASQGLYTMLGREYAAGDRFIDAHIIERPGSYAQIDLQDRALPDSLREAIEERGWITAAQARRYEEVAHRPVPNAFDIAGKEAAALGFKAERTSSLGSEDASAARTIETLKQILADRQKAIALGSLEDRTVIAPTRSQAEAVRTAINVAAQRYAIEIDARRGAALAERMERMDFERNAPIPGEPSGAYTIPGRGRALTAADLDAMQALSAERAGVERSSREI